MSKAVVFFADGTEECEALLVVDLLRRAKVEVIVASAMGRRELVSTSAITLQSSWTPWWKRCRAPMPLRRISTTM